MRITLAGCLALMLVASADAPAQQAALRVLIASANEQRLDEFEALLKKQGMRTGRPSCRELTKEKARGFDVVVVDPETGPAKGDGLAAKLGAWEAEDLGRPAVVIGTTGGHAMARLRLKIGKNG